MAAATYATSPFLLPTPLLVYAAGAQSAFDEETVDAVPTYDLWKDRKAVVAFAGHFGYALCGKRANYLEAKKIIWSYMEGIDKTGCCRSSGIPYLEVAARLDKSSMQRNASIEEEGGIIVSGPGKRNVSYIHKDKEAGDDPDIQEIIQACCS